MTTTEAKREVARAAQAIRLADQQFGHAIELLRKTRLVGMDALAREMGVSLPTLNRIQKGELLDTLLLRRIIKWAEKGKSNAD